MRQYKALARNHLAALPAVVAIAAFLLASCSSAATPPAASSTPSQPASGGTPNCTAANSKVADPTAPHGIFVLEGNAQGATGQAILKYLLPNPDVCGVDFWVRWNQVDRGPQTANRYDWSRVEADMAPWEQAGKQVNLILIGAAEGAAQAQGATPSYVLSQVQVVTCGGQSQPTPIFWQPGYERNWHDFIAQTLSHFASNTHIGYLRFGLGIGGEGLVGPAAERPGPCKQLWDAAGYQTEWPAYNQRLIAFEASQRSVHQLMIGIADTLAASNVAQAAAAGIGFGQQGLKARDVTDIANNATCVPSDWCHLFRKYAGKVPLEVQQLALSNPSGAPATPGVTGTGPGSPESVATGPLPPLLTAALSVQTQVFEVYADELLMAFDPAWPGHDKYGASYAAAFASLAKVVGTTNGAQPVG